MYVLKALIFKDNTVLFIVLLTRFAIVFGNITWTAQLLHVKLWNELKPRLEIAISRCCFAVLHNEWIIRQHYLLEDNVEWLVTYLFPQLYTVGYLLLGI